MKFYPEVAKFQGLTAEQIIANWTWALYCDVTCEDCGKVWSWANAGGVGAPCKKCGGKCI